MNTASFQQDKKVSLNQAVPDLFSFNKFQFKLFVLNAENSCLELFVFNLLEYIKLIGTYTINRDLIIICIIIDL